MYVKWSLEENTWEFNRECAQGEADTFYEN